MARWFVRLSGDPFDRELLPHWFPDGDIHAFHDNGIVCLAGPLLEESDNAEDVRRVADEALDRFTGVIYALGQEINRPSVAQVVRESDTGERSATIFMIGSYDDREKRAPRVQEASALLQRLSTSRHLDDAIRLWADGVRTWPRLYRILEEIETHLGQSVDGAGLCESAQREVFRHTANTTAAGRDARHGGGKFQPPGSPMTLGDAIQFVGQMLRRVAG